MSFEVLPPEVIVKIFRFLTPREIVDNRKVCLKWKKCSSDMSLWNCMNVIGEKEGREDDFGEITMTEMIQLVQEGARKISKLNISWSSKEDTAFILNLCVANSLPLNYIMFGISCDVQTDIIQALAIKPTGASITEIDFCHQTNLSGDIMIFSQLPNLKKFGNQFLRTDHLRSKQFAMSCLSLTEVFVGDLNVSHEDMRRLLYDRPLLEGLTLETCGLEEKGPFDIFRGNEKLTMICIENCYVTGKKVLGTVDYTPLFTLPNLKTLECDMENSQHTPNQLFQMCSQSVTSLTISGLYTSDQRLRDNDLDIIGRRLHNLEYFKIYSDYVSDFGIYMFLNQAKKIEVLAIATHASEHPIIGLEWAPILATHPSLKFLNLYECSMAEVNANFIKQTCRDAGIRLEINERSSSKDVSDLDYDFNF